MLQPTGIWFTINLVALDFLQWKNQIACRHCYDTVIGGMGRIVPDDQRWLRTARSGTEAER